MSLDEGSILFTSSSFPLTTSPGGVDSNRYSFEDFYDVAESDEAEEPHGSWKPNMNESESIKLLRDENKKVREELEVAENQIAEFQAAMPPIYDELESKTNEIQYLQDALESSQRKYEILHERQKKLEMKMTWTDQTMQEQLNLISDETSAEVEGIKERLLKEVNRLKKELSIESHERNVLVNDLVMVKQQLSKLRKAKDDEREAYILNTAELERASRDANREKHKLRITVEDMREHICGLESELEKQKVLVAEKEQLLQTREEDLLNKTRKNYALDKSTSCRATILHDNLAAELSHSENIITQLRQEKMNTEDDLAEFKEQLEKTLELVESAYTNISPGNESGKGKLLLQKAIAQTREFLGLPPIPEENASDNDKENTPESIDDINLFDDRALILEQNLIGAGWDEVDLLNLSTEEKASEIIDEASVEPEQSPGVDQMQEFKVEVFKEVTNMKQVLLKEFQQLAQEHLRPSMAEETIMNTIQNSTQDSAKAVIDWMERDRRSVAEAHESENATEMQRLKTTFQSSLDDQQKKSEVTVGRLRKKMADLEHALKNSEVEVETLRKHRLKDAAEKLRLKSQFRNKVDELKVAAVVQEILPELCYKEEDVMQVHRLNTMDRLSIDVQRACVTKFLQTYSKPSEWKTVPDYQLHTTTYIFDFEGISWKTRISFLYPFVNYMTQVIGVNKKNLGSVFVILPTSTVTMKISRLSNSFSKILETLLTHNSNSLWNYIYIFLDNVSTHYGNIKRYVGSRTRTAKHGEDREKQTIKQVPMLEGVLRPTMVEPTWEEDNKNSGAGASGRFANISGRRMSGLLFMERRSSCRKHAEYPLKAVF